MSINTHGTIPHCKSMLATRFTIHILRYLDSVAAPQPAPSAARGKLPAARSARTADKTDERQADGTNSDHPAAPGSLWGRVWVLPRRLLPSGRTRRDRRHTRVDPCRPRDWVAGARAHWGPFSLSLERRSWSWRNRGGCGWCRCQLQSVTQISRVKPLALRQWSSCYRFRRSRRHCSGHSSRRGKADPRLGAAVQIFDCSGLLCFLTIL